MRIENRGYLGLILMKALALEYNTALELIDDIEVQAKRQGYKITITKL